MENKRRIVNKKFMASLLTTSILLSVCACNTKKEEPVETKIIIQTVVVTATPDDYKETIIETENTTAETTTETTLEPTNTPTPVPTNTNTPTPIPTNTPKPKTTTPSETTEYHSVDDSGINGTLDYIYNKINWIINKKENVDFNKVKESSIKYAKELIDFIFYGGEMNGITFDELKDDARQEVYTKLQKIDSFIMQFIPDYKEKLGEKYNWVKDFANTTLKKAKEIFNSHIDIDINVNKGNSKVKSLILKK